MTSLTPVAIIVDRVSAQIALSTISQLGGCYLEDYRQWRATESPFLLMVATNPQRIRRRMPTVYHCASCAQLVDGIRQSTDAAARGFVWSVFLAQDSIAERLVDRELASGYKIVRRSPKQSKRKGAKQ